MPLIELFPGVFSEKLILTATNDWLSSMTFLTGNSPERAVTKRS